MTTKKVTIARMRAAPSFAFQYCDICGGQYSANPADYFLTNEKHVFKCCDHNVRLVVRRCRLVEVAT